MANIHDHNRDSRGASSLLFICDSSNPFDQTLHGNSRMIVVVEDCTISAATISEAVGGAGAAGLAGDYPAGTILPNGITEITLTSGKIFIY